MGRIGGIWGLIILVAAVWAIVNVAQSNATAGKKTLWIVLLILVPVLGFIIWLIAGPKSNR